MRIHIGSSQEGPIQGRIVFIAEDAVDRFRSIGIAKHHAEKREVSIWRQNEVPTLFVGLGDINKGTLEDLRAAAGVAARTAQKEGWAHVTVELPGIFGKPAIEAQAIAEGAILGTYEFDRYKSQRKNRALVTLTILADGAEVEAAVNKGVVFATATSLARDLANEPPNVLRPAVLAEFVSEHFDGTAASVTVFADDELVSRQMMGLIHVGKGSENKPRFISIRYQSDPKKPLVALVGKGLTYDSGGISLKSGRDLSDMRMDMAGAAAVIGAIDALVKLKVPCNVVGLLVAAENLPDAGSMIPGELIQYPNGTSVQVANTDAEGRLVLADALLYAQHLGATQVIDIATLTGAAANALGTRYAALFGGDAIVRILRAVGLQTGDDAWPMPLPDEYEDQLKSVYADVSNIGKGNGGAITAALFLRRFVGKEQAWAHVDMAGPMEVDKTAGYRVEGASGYGVRLLAEYVITQTSM